jgi:hypothetical protein
MRIASITFVFAFASLDMACSSFSTDGTNPSTEGTPSHTAPMIQTGDSADAGSGCTDWTCPAVDAGEMKDSGGGAVDACADALSPPPPQDAGKQEDSGNNNGGCTLTQGFWKNHPGSWPVSMLTLGSMTYSESELIDLLETPPKGDASLILAHQLIAALLNVDNGAGTSATVASAIADAQAWLSMFSGSLPYGIPASSSDGSVAVTLSSELDAFNEGKTGTPHCSDAPTPVIPTGY